MPEKLPVHIRWMIRRDVPEVLAIEQDAFEFPWSEDDFVRVMRRHQCIGMVAESADPVTGDLIAGFMFYELHKTRIHILNLAVAWAFRSRRVGEQMVQKLIGKLSAGRPRLLVDVRETNLAAQIFFRDQGFLAVEVLRDHYEDTEEDAYAMEYHLLARANRSQPERGRTKHYGG